MDVIVVTQREGLHTADDYQDSDSDMYDEVDDLRAIYSVPRNVVCSLYVGDGGLNPLPTMHRKQLNPLPTMHRKQFNPLPTIGNSLKKQKSLYKVLAPSIKPPI